MTSEEDHEFEIVLRDGKRASGKKRPKSADQKKVHRQRQKQVKKARKAEVQNVFNDLVLFYRLSYHAIRTQAPMETTSTS